MYGGGRIHAATAAFHRPQIIRARVLDRIVAVLFHLASGSMQRAREPLRCLLPDLFVAKTGEPIGRQVIIGRSQRLLHAPALTLGIAGSVFGRIELQVPDARFRSVAAPVSQRVAAGEIVPVNRMPRCQTFPCGGAIQLHLFRATCYPGLRNLLLIYSFSIANRVALEGFVTDCTGVFGLAQVLYLE